MHEFRYPLAAAGATAGGEATIAVAAGPVAEEDDDDDRGLAEHFACLDDHRVCDGDAAEGKKRCRDDGDDDNGQEFKEADDDDDGTSRAENAPLVVPSSRRRSTGVLSRWCVCQ